MKAWKTLALLAIMLSSTSCTFKNTADDAPRTPSEQTQSSPPSGVTEDPGKPIPERPSNP